MLALSAACTAETSTHAHAHRPVTNQVRVQLALTLCVCYHGSGHTSDLAAATISVGRYRQLEAIA